MTEHQYAQATGGTTAAPEQNDLSLAGRGGIDCRSLFPGVSAHVRTMLENSLPRALRRVWPLSRPHRATLVDDIAELSEMLTASRSELKRPYWASPALTSAYLYYFLPWNLVRLTRLFAGLSLPAPTEGAGPALLADLGSGPLTVPIALWIAHPEWRDRKVEIVALDTAGRPPHLGAKLLEALAAESHCEPWTVHVVQSPIGRAGRVVQSFAHRGLRPWLVTAANVLNELPPARRERFVGDGETGMDSEGGEAMGFADMAGDSPLERFAETLFPLLFQGQGGAAPELLLVEPGTRLGGTTLMEMRSLAREAGLVIRSPCLHGDTCPLAKSSSAREDVFADIPHARPSRLAGRTWCHFTFLPDGAPRWLARLSEEAGLAKDTLSLSLLELAAPAEGNDAVQEDLKNGTALEARVISQPFGVPGMRGSCRYACSSRGLLLLEGADAFPSGSRVMLPEAPCADAQRDGRSGALICRASWPVAEHSRIQARKKSGAEPAAEQKTVGEECTRARDAERSGRTQDRQRTQGAGKKGAGHGQPKGGSIRKEASGTQGKSRKKRVRTPKTYFGKSAS